MHLEPTFALICAIVFFAFMTQTATGFGAMLIAMALGALIYPVSTLLSWFIPLVILLSCYLLYRDHSHIDWRILFKVILPGMLVGMVFGQYLFYSLDSIWLKKALGVIIILLAGRELLRREGSTPAKPPMLPWTLAAGVIHGIFATGGPLLVYALNGQGLAKKTFRGTLSMVWLLLAIVLLTSLIVSQKLTTAALPNIGILAAILPLAIIVGEWVHRRINPVTFQKLVNVLLVASGLMLVL